MIINAEFFKDKFNTLECTITYLKFGLGHKVVNFRSNSLLRCKK